MPPSFAELGVPSQIATSLTERDITAPFPIQAATIADALAGRDVCGKAPTGSGKTIAFGIPMVMGSPRSEPKRPTGLVLVPTRELAVQVESELKLLGEPVRCRVLAVYGGVSIANQVKRLSRGIDVIVATPGRLLDLVDQRAVRLREVAMITIDEADRMADMGFMPDVKKILDLTADERQVLLFSATLDGDVDALVSRYLDDPVRHDVSSNDGADDDSRVDHLFWQAAHGDRIRLTAMIADRMGPTIVFSRTRHGADRITRQLGDWRVKAVALHGDKTQAARSRALADFHQHKVDVLVATDVAARGIHVDDVAAVVHFDPPADHKDYQHRSGRTGRAGSTGLVVSLVTSQTAAQVNKLRRELKLSGDLVAPGTFPDHTPGRDKPTPTRARLPGEVGSVRSQVKRSG